MCLCLCAGVYTVRVEAQALTTLGGEGLNFQKQETRERAFRKIEGERYLRKLKGGKGDLRKLN